MAHTLRLMYREREQREQRETTLERVTSSVDGTRKTVQGAPLHPGVTGGHGGRVDGFVVARVEHHVRVVRTVATGRNRGGGAVRLGRSIAWSDSIAAAAAVLVAD